MLFEIKISLPLNVYYNNFNKSFLIKIQIVCLYFFFNIFKNKKKKTIIIICHTKIMKNHESKYKHKKKRKKVKEKTKLFFFSLIIISIYDLSLIKRKYLKIDQQ